MELQSGLDRVVQAFAYYVSVLLVAVQGMDVYKALFIRYWQLLGNQIVVEHTIGPHITLV